MNKKTAKANGEIGSGQVTRRNHGGKAVATEGVTSTKIDKERTIELRKREKENENIVY